MARELKLWLECLLVAAIVWLAVSAGLAVRTATDVVAGLPGQVDAAAARLSDEVASARIDAFAELTDARREVLAKTDRQLTLLRADVMGQVRLTREAADRRVGDSLARVDAAIAQVDLARKDVAPVVKSAAELVKHADADVVAAKPVLDKAAAAEQDAIDSWDDLYPDVNAAVQSSNVVLNQVGQAAIESRAAAVSNVDNVAGITADIHTLTTAATKPKSFLGKVWGVVTVFSRFAGLL